jgi:hypothetical protein
MLLQPRQMDPPSRGHQDGYPPTSPTRSSFSNELLRETAARQCDKSTEHSSRDRLVACVDLEDALGTDLASESASQRLVLLVSALGCIL